jgi:hypothetical protein
MPSQNELDAHSIFPRRRARKERTKPSQPVFHVVQSSETNDRRLGVWGWVVQFWAFILPPVILSRVPRSSHADRRFFIGPRKLDFQNFALIMPSKRWNLGDNVPFLGLLERAH